MASIGERVHLCDGNSMPLFGFGCWDLDNDGDVAYNSVTAALKEGYRLIDTAALYGNEESVGRALKASSIKREDLFVVTKLDLHKHGYETAKKSLKESLDKLGLEYVDLFLVHTPMPGKVLETWKAIIELKKEGKAKSIGVSNFNGEHIQALLDAGLEKPAVNQFEIHPMHRRDEVVKYCRDNNITVMGYCPLARGQILKPGTCSLAEEISTKVNKSVSQVCLRWALQKRYITIPKSTSAVHIRENCQLYDFVLSDEEMSRFENLKTDMQISVACEAMKHTWNEIKDNDKPGQWEM